MEDKGGETQPTHEVCMPFNGALLKVGIWRKVSKQGTPRYTAMLSRGTKAEGQNKWSWSRVLDRDELLGAARLLEVAHGFVIQDSQRRDNQ